MSVTVIDAEAGLDALCTKIGARPLIVCDVDEVVLRFVLPFKAYLLANDHELRLESFSLNGNVTCLSTGVKVPDGTVDRLLSGFYDHQEDWQVPFDDARDTLDRLKAFADVVLLTAMPPCHAEMRRRLLERFGFALPMIATERSKGEVVRRLAEAGVPDIVFIDDMLYNCRSVSGAVPQALAINLLIDSDYRAIAPKTAEPAVLATGWPDAERLVRDRLSDGG
ncbi:hypothetical protein FJU08_14175 [Martelella alba]|uniref:Uncharacterized protein n=1 Tax=Martelella alba TaxID=2590451 RepID=A0A506U935_9HYPH|nr:hypothetical protein [Martelella alba]TPW29475.1 hypothetical protein FJU08_14175 [Martelella alba]